MKRHFAEMNFYARARSTGQMGEVVKKLKDNLRHVSSFVCVISASCLYGKSLQLHGQNRQPFLCLSDNASATL